MGLLTTLRTEGELLRFQARPTPGRRRIGLALLLAGAPMSWWGATRTLAGLDEGVPFLGFGLLALGIGLGLLGHHYELDLGSGRAVQRHHLLSLRVWRRETLLPSLERVELRRRLFRGLHGYFGENLVILPAPGLELVLFRDRDAARPAELALAVADHLGLPLRDERRSLEKLIDESQAELPRNAPRALAIVVFLFAFAAAASFVCGG